MSGWWIALLAVAGVPVILALASLALDRRFALRTRADEVHHARTSDGWLIALHRYRPARPSPGREPVILCHGLLSNRFSMDLDGHASLAAHLRDEGFDVWSMELRARGASRRDPSRPRRGRLRSAALLGFDWSIDEFVREDLPAAVRSVLDRTGAGSLHWVGHSLGGMILYAHAAAGDTTWFRAAVTLDSPGHFGPLRMPTWPVRLYARAVPVVPVLLFKPIASVLYQIFPASWFRRLVYLERPTLLAILHNGLVNLGSSRVLLHLCSCLSEGRFRSFDRRVDYEAGPSRIRFPLMVVRAPAGRSPEPCVKHAYETCPAAAKTWVRCGLADGFSMDHNHFTLVIGRTASSEIFPVIAAWLRRHSSDAAPPAGGGGGAV